MRYTALIGGIFYGLVHQGTLQRKYDDDKVCSSVIVHGVSADLAPHLNKRNHISLYRPPNELIFFPFLLTYPTRCHHTTT